MFLFRFYALAWMWEYTGNCAGRVLGLALIVAAIYDHHPIELQGLSRYADHSPNRSASYCSRGAHSPGLVGG